MKKIDIRKIYVCEIMKISDIYSVKTDEDDVAYLLGRAISTGKKTQIFYETEDNNVSFGLFIKGITGYKHILTGVKYKLASSPLISVGEQVLNPDNIELLTKRERVLASHLIDKYQSFDMDISVIKALEERINRNAKYIEENKEVTVN